MIAPFASLRPLIVLVLACGLVAGDPDYQQYDGMAHLGAFIDVPSAEQQSANGIDARTGVSLISIMPDTAAARMGLQANDVVLSANGSSLGSMTDFRNEVALAGVGGRIDLVVARDGQRVALSGTLGEWPKDLPRTPIDPASERSWRDWQAQRLKRMQESAADLQRKIEDLERRSDASAAVAPVQDLAQAARLPYSQAFRALPPWRITLQLRQEDAGGPAASREGATAWDARVLIGSPEPELF